MGKFKNTLDFMFLKFFFLNIQSTFRLNEGLLIFSQMVPLLIGVGDPINREGIDLNYDSTLKLVWKTTIIKYKYFMGLKNDFLQACFKSIKLIKKRLNKLTVSSQQEVLIYFLIPNLFHVKHVRKAMMRDQGPSIGENGLRGLEWDRTWGV